MKKKPLFISFEGGEGSGKSSLVRRLGSSLEAAGHELVLSREPGGSSLSEKIRKVLLDSQEPIDPTAELLLFLAARAQHLNELILPALEDQKMVLCDRYHDSSIAYQGIARGLGLEKVKSLCASTGRWPDLTIYLDLDPKIGIERARNRRALDKIESEPIAFHEKIRHGFLDLARQEPKRIFVLDAEQAIDAVFEQALSIVLEHLS